MFSEPRIEFAKSGKKLNEFSCRCSIAPRRIGGRVINPNQEHTIDDYFTDAVHLKKKITERTPRPSILIEHYKNSSRRLKQRLKRSINAHVRGAVTVRQRTKWVAVNNVRLRLLISLGVLPHCCRPRTRNQLLFSVSQLTAPIVEWDTADCCVCVV